VVVRNGVRPECSPTPDPEADRWAARTLDAGEAARGWTDLLHVGSPIPRKRIDLLLRIFAALARQHPSARLIRVGGAFTSAQRDLLRSLQLDDRLVTLPYLTSSQLAAVYRRAALLLLPSEREGFGLPVIEAMACGVPVVASDLPVLRETGGDAATYCALDDIPAWSAAVSDLLRRRNIPGELAAIRSACLRQAARFSWSSYAASMGAIIADVWSRVDEAAASAGASDPAARKREPKVARLWSSHT
jgi:glycosyltransferase involved in cell wall biosynthesis